MELTSWYEDKKDYTGNRSSYGRGPVGVIVQLQVVGLYSFLPGKDDQALKSIPSTIYLLPYTGTVDFVERRAEIVTSNAFECR